MTWPKESQFIHSQQNVSSIDVFVLFLSLFYFIPVNLKEFLVQLSERYHCSKNWSILKWFGESILLVMQSNTCTN